NDVMSRPPRRPDQPFLTRPFTAAIVRTGLLIFLLTLAIFGYYLQAEPAKATTMAFTVFILLQLANALNCRSWRRPFFENLAGNKYLILALLLALGLHLSILSWAPLQTMFGTAALGASDWGILIAAAALMLVQEEAFKRYRTAAED
ncbi:MAG: cation transporting ATPase C-terminal domain-containing protein, partial [Candidatus Micrarchaeota archaeon]|nr:cation transporting ATPase C-terminal domain-containing protein [Candidatus Micrarchaeota archaeon]